MKWIQWFLAVIVALPVLGAVLLLLAGQREGAGGNVARVEIQRPPEEVFRHLEAVERLHGWTRMTEVEQLTPLPLQTGSRFRAVTVRRGQGTEVLIEVTALERNDKIAFASRTAEGASGALAQSAVNRFEGQAGRCVLTVTVQTRFDGILLGPLEPLTTPAAQRELKRLLRSLKAQVESESSPPVHGARTTATATDRRRS